MFAKFQAYVNNPLIIKNKIKELEEDYRERRLIDYVEINEHLAKSKLIHEFVDKYSTGTFLINDGLFIDGFTDKTKLDILKPFSNPKECYGYPAKTNYEVFKMVTSIWPKYMSVKSGYSWHNPPKTWPHNEFFQLFYSIQTCLRRFYHTSEEEFAEFRKEHYEKLGEGYPYHQYLGFLHLIPDCNAIFDRVYKLPYGDAQDFLMFSVAHMPLPGSLPVLRKAFTYWDADYGDSRISFHDKGTGIIGQLESVVLAWRDRGFNGFRDPVIGPVLMKHVARLRLRPPVPPPRKSK
jgi:hypothetical protein